jgi:hypothetical protein
MMEVRLQGTTIPVRAQGDPEVAAETLALVNERLEVAAARAKGHASYQIAVLALLDLAQEYVEAKRRAREQYERVEDAARRLAEEVGGNA